MSSEELPVYDKLWDNTSVALARGEPPIDPYLADKRSDLRHGITLVLRPSSSVREKVREYLDELAGICPDQYFYRPEEFHVTVLPIVSGSEHWQSELPLVDSYKAIIGQVLNHHRSFHLEFRGVTASPSGILIQGFQVGDELRRIRNDLREAFTEEGVGGILDRRYKSTTAHMTAMRFEKLGGNWGKLKTFVENSRRIAFGASEVKSLQLILGDWYASADTVRVLQEYQFPIKASEH